MHSSRSEFIELQGAKFHVRRWGNPKAPMLFMLHGWMDVSATFQFVVDEFQQEWSVVAPDWRGYGLSEWRGERYSLQDDVADLDMLLEHYSSDQPARLVGHSYGGAIAGVYAGTRPDRVSGLISIEGFGQRTLPLDRATRLMAAWLDARKQRPRQRMYADRRALAERLRSANPRLSETQASFFAKHFGMCRSDGGITLAADPWRQMRGFPPSLPTADFFMQFFSHIVAPVLWVRATDSKYMRSFFSEKSTYDRRFRSLQDRSEAVVEDAGHNIQHDQPQELAKLIEVFFDRAITPDDQDDVASN